MFDYKDNQEEFFALHIPFIFDSFYFNGKPIRVLYIEDVLWWFLCDICGVIGLSSASSAALRLDVYEKMTLSLTSSHSGQRGGARKAILINEAGLYHLLLTSNKSEARALRRWVTTEVLPSIRKTGGYIMDQDTMGAGELADAAQEVVRNALAERDQKIHRLRLEDEAKAALLCEWEPKARYYDAVLQNPALLPITMIAKEYGLSARALNNYLQDRNVQYKCNGTWVLCQPYDGKGYTYPQTALYEPCPCNQRIRWTQKGRAFLHDFLREDGIVPLYERPDVPMDGLLWQ